MTHFKFLIPIIGIAALFTTCKPPKFISPQPEVVNDTIFVMMHDTVIVTDTVKVLTEEAIVAMYKVERMQRYLDIVNSNSKNKEFLHGWLRRVLDGED